MMYVTLIVVISRKIKKENIIYPTQVKHSALLLNIKLQEATASTDEKSTVAMQTAPPD